MTSDKFLWALRPFIYLFQQFWGPEQEVLVAGYTPPDYVLPDNFEFYSIAQPEYPVDDWSKGLLKVLRHKVTDDIFILLLEDYWLCRQVDTVGIGLLADLVRDTPEILRMDLTTDRMYNGAAKDVGYCGHFDLVETDPESEYQMSLQAGIWRRQHMLNLFRMEDGSWRDELSPWEVELHISPTLVEWERAGTTFRVLGTQQCPVRYINAFRKGDPGKVLNADKLPGDIRAEMAEKGWLKGE